MANELATSEDTHLGANDEGDQRNGNHDIDPHKPSQECKVGGYAGAEVWFDFLDAQLPGNEDGKEAGRLTFPVSPSLQKMSDARKDLFLERNGSRQVRILIGLPAQRECHGAHIARWTMRTVGIYWMSVPTGKWPINCVNINIFLHGFRLVLVAFRILQAFPPKKKKKGGYKITYCRH